MKVVKSDWHSKLKENIGALLRIKVERPEIEQFIKEHSSDAAAFWWDAKEQRKGGNVKRKEKYQERSRKIKQIRFTNKFNNAFLEKEQWVR